MRCFIIITIFILFAFSVDTFAQSNKTGTWGIVTIVLPSDTMHRWGGYVESQIRTDQVLFGHYFYNEVKGGVSFAIDNNYVALMGTGHYTTFDYTDLSKPAQTTENRFWEQLTYSQYLNRIKFEHRYRIEQRWVNGSYRNRYRYRLNLVIPFNHKKMGANTVFLSVFDEIFLNNKQPNFERNRVSASIGYQFSKMLTAQAGWINQYNNSLTSSVNKNNILLGLIYQINRKKGQQELPTVKD